MKIELSISKEAFHDWDAFAGIRDLIANAKDAEAEQSAPMKVFHKKDTLFIENEGAILPHEALLVGTSTKRDRSDCIGRFGEGLKASCVALVRAGHAVRIRSGGETWTPKIERSEKFKADVLVFHITKGNLDKRRVVVEVSGIDAVTWESMQRCFLFLRSDLRDVRIETSYGALLTANDLKGRLHVKGVFVQHDPKLGFGYDFHDANLDRDRKMVASWDRDWRMRTIWSEALNKRPDLGASFATLLDEEAPDVIDIDAGNASYIPKPARQAIADAFVKKHGEGALPVSTLSDSAELEHMGKKGVVAPKPLRAVLESVLGTAEAAKSELKNEVVKLYGWHELEGFEKRNLERAIRLVRVAVPTLSLDVIDVADFRSAGTMGFYKEGRVFLSKRGLADREEVLTTLVHETAHLTTNGSADGSLELEWKILKVWSAIVAHLDPEPKAEMN